MQLGGKLMKKFILSLIIFLIVAACGGGGGGGGGSGGESAKIISAAAGTAHTIALAESGNIYTTGKNNYGQLGLGNTEDADTFTKVNAPWGADKAIFASASLNHTVVLTESGSMYATGLNYYGELGLESSGFGANKSSFTQVNTAGMGKVVSASAGKQYTVILTESGEIYATGENDTGQLGLGDNTNRNVFTKVEIKPWGADRVVSISARTNHTIIVTESGRVYTTGGNNEGQLGLGDNVARNTFTLATLAP